MYSLLRYMATAAGLLMFLGSATEALPQERAQKSEKVTLSLENATLSDAITQIGERYGLNIVADCFLNDAIIPKLEFRDAPVSDVVPKLAGLFGRSFQVVNGVAVLRDRMWHVQPAREREFMRQAGIGWRDRGTVKVSRLKAELAVMDREGPSATPVAAGFEKEHPYAARLPARLIFLKAARAPVGDVIRELDRVSGWEAGVAPALSTRRMTACLSSITPGQAVEAIGFLLNARPRLVIEQSEAQKALEADLLDGRSARLKLSDQLKDKLCPLLTKEQQERLARGEEVSLQINTLPASLRPLAEQYIRESFGALGSAGSGFGLDFSRLKEFGVVFLPPPSKGLGVNGFTPDGQRIHF